MTADRRPRVVYVAKAGRSVIYVGQTLNLRKRVHEHKAASAWCVPGIFFAAVKTVWGSGAADKLEAELIAKYQPLHNTQLTNRGTDVPVTNADGVTVAQAAELIGCSQKTVRRAARYGHIRLLGRRVDPNRPGTYWVLDAADVARMAAAARVAA